MRAGCTLCVGEGSQACPPCQSASQHGDSCARAHDHALAHVAQSRAQHPAPLGGCPPPCSIAVRQVSSVTWSGRALLQADHLPFQCTSSLCAALTS